MEYNMHPTYKKQFYFLLSLFTIMIIWIQLFPVGTIFKIYLIGIIVYQFMFFLGSSFGVGPLKHIYEQGKKYYEKNIERPKQPWEK